MTGNGPTYDDVYGSAGMPPAPGYEGVAAELVAMAEADHRLQAGAAGSFAEQLAWRRVTVGNGDRLRGLLSEVGWPAPALVGTAASRSAWLVAQHADRQLDVQRLALAALERAVAEGADEPRKLAFLRDRVLVNEGREQVCGTQIAGVVDGAPVPWPCADPDRMDDLRAEAGIEPFAQHVARFAAPPGAS